MVEELLKELTLEEKIGMIHGAGLFRTEGVPRLGIPAVKFSDGPMGVRHEFENDKWSVIGNSDDYVTYLPSNSALASTWNRELAYDAGNVLGEETRGRGKDVILAPGINIKRSPLCGRNFEYMSEDPYLSGEMAVPLIQGIQTADVAACVKHFAINNQETERLWVEVQVSDRTLREIYLPAFEKAVKEGNSLSLMGAYNRYKGEHCCESKELLNRILREEWGYDGMVVSDWGAVHKTEEAATSGLDIEMSVTDNFDEYCMAQPLKKLVEEGVIEESLIDEKVRNILRMMERLHMLDPQNRKKGSYNTPEHREKVLEAARESVVLLKNDAGRLPLCEEETKRILIIGDNANRIHSCGGGSAEIKALYEISPLMGIRKLLGGNAEITYVPGYFADDCDGQASDVNWQAESLENGGGSALEKKNADEALLQRQRQLREEAVALAKDHSFDAVILIGGQNHQQDLEGHDRPDMKLPYGQDALIEAVLEVRKDTVLVLLSGSPVEMPWIDKADTLVWSWYAGMEGGTALAEVLFGEVNPSGKLPETFPKSHMDCSAHCIGEFPGRVLRGADVIQHTEEKTDADVLQRANAEMRADVEQSVDAEMRTDVEQSVDAELDTGEKQNSGTECGSDSETSMDRDDMVVRYTEGIMVGYRYYDTYSVPVLFPFGHGLSYTEYEYSNLAVKKEGAKFRVELDVTNTGARAGKEIVQFYVGKKEGYERARKELKGFEKVCLKPQETKHVVLELGQSAFSYYDEEQAAFVTEPGTYCIYAGKSVADICLQAEVEL